MQVGRRTRATAHAIAVRVDAITATLRGVVVALVAVTVALIALAVRRPVVGAS